MPRRHTNGFEVLGLDADPTPGDPDALLGKLVPTYTSLGDDAAAAADVLTSREVTEGRGEAMEKLREVVGTKYPEKLRKAATSFREAGEAYSAYARTLSETQSEIDRAMDQALPVATLAAEAPPQPASDASADDRRAAQQRGAQIDDARGVLTGARRLAADAKALREQAAGKLRDELEHVTVVPARSLFQKFLEWFKNNPVLQIILGIVVGIVSIFFPIVGFALGALTFGLLTAFNTLATGKLDVGALVVGFLTLGFGGGMAAIRLIPSIGAKVGSATSSAGRFLTSLPGPIGPGLRSTGDFLRNSPILKKALLASTEGFVPGAVINSIGGAINAKDGTPFNAAVIFSGALVGGVAGGAGGALATRFGPGLNSVFGKPGSSPPPATRSAPGEAAPAPVPAPAPAPAPASTSAPAPAPALVTTPSRPATPEVQPVPGSPAPSRPASPAPSTESEFQTAPSSPVTGTPGPTRPSSPAPSVNEPTPGTPGPSRPATPAPADPAPAPAPAPAAPGTPTPETPSPDPSTVDKAANSTVIGVSVGADGGTKVLVTERQNSEEHGGQLVGQEATGGQAGLAAGSPTNRTEPITKGSGGFGRVGR